MRAINVTAGFIIVMENRFITADTQAREAEGNEDKECTGDDDDAQLQKKVLPSGASHIDLKMSETHTSTKTSQ